MRARTSREPPGRHQLNFQYPLKGRRTWAGGPIKWEAGFLLSRRSRRAAEYLLVSTVLVTGRRSGNGCWKWLQSLTAVKVAAGNSKTRMFAGQTAPG